MLPQLDAILVFDLFVRKRRWVNCQLTRDRVPQKLSAWFVLIKKAPCCERIHTLDQVVPESCA